MKDRIVSAVTRSQRGQTTAEYAVVLGILTVAVVTIFTTVLPGAIEGALNSVVELL